MKKYINMVLLFVIAFFISKQVYAADPLVITRERVDFRFFVENEEGKDVEGLEFSLHDLNNVYNFTSTYNTTLHCYQFDVNSSETKTDTEYLATNLPGVFTDAEISSMSNNNFSSSVFNSEQFAVLVNGGFATTNAGYFKYLPMVLEKTSGDTVEDIKKIVYAIIHVIPGQEAYKYDVVLQLVNNTFIEYGSGSTSLIFPTPTASYIQLGLFPDFYNPQLVNTRHHITAYNANATNILNFDGIEDETYLNRSTEVYNEDGSSYTNNQRRSSDDNIDDSSYDAMVATGSLPVIAATTKIVPENPQTFNNMYMIIAVLYVLGCGLFILYKRNKIMN